ncbi:MAG: aminotransferase class V-fold PLP-dependent enzyme [Firmicutes bacterium]|nr:aminotransferase class V-fold PLP-dependent enzyme [Bacillota bacterium]
MNEWQKGFRALFPNCEKRVYLEAAVQNGGCTRVEAAVKSFFDEYYSGVINGKHQWDDAAGETRELLAELLGGVSPKHIAFTKNTVEGLNMIARGFPFKKGDNVVIAEIEHSSNVFPWLMLKEKGVEVRMVKAERDQLPARLYEEQMDENTRIVAVSHVQAPNGYKHDLKELAGICHKYGAYLVVDAIQSLGMVPFDAEGWGVDAVCSGCHKNLLALPGVGFMYMTPELMRLVKPVFAGANAALSIDKSDWTVVCKDEEDARKYEMSNLSYTAIYSLREGLKIVREIGVQNIQAYVAPLSAKLNKGLRDIGYYVATPEDPRHRSNINSVIVPDLAGMRQWFIDRGVWISKMDAGYIRFSVGGFSNEDDVNAGLEKAAEYYELFVKER